LECRDFPDSRLEFYENFMLARQPIIHHENASLEARRKLSAEYSRDDAPTSGVAVRGGEARKAVRQSF
jgi:hypothetical protein